MDVPFIRSLEFRAFGPDVSTDSFECHRYIDWFLKVQALGYQQKRLARTFCWMDGQRVAGYMATLMTSADFSKRKEEMREAELVGVAIAPEGRTLDRFPALLIGMLGVSQQYRRKGLGEFMVRFAVGMAEVLSDGTGCRFVTVDADRTDEAIRCYEKVGFSRAETDRQAEAGGALRQRVWMYYDLKPRPPQKLLTAP